MDTRRNSREQLISMTSDCEQNKQIDTAVTFITESARVTKQLIEKERTNKSQVMNNWFMFVS